MNWCAMDVIRRRCAASRRLPKPSATIPNSPSDASLWSAPGPSRTGWPKSSAVRADVHVVREQGALKIEVRLLDMKRAAVPMGEARQADTIYVASDPGLLSTSNSSFRTATEQVISDDGIATKLVNWEIAKTRPDVIEDVTTHTRYELRSKHGNGAASGERRRPLPHTELQFLEPGSMPFR